MYEGYESVVTKVRRYRGAANAKQESDQVERGESTSEPTLSGRLGNLKSESLLEDQIKCNAVGEKLWDSTPINSMEKNGSESKCERPGGRQEGLKFIKRLKF